MLTRRAAETTSDLADKSAATPQGARLIQEVAHLRSHVAEARWRTKYDRIVLLELIGHGDGRRLIQLKSGGAREFKRYQLRHALYRYLGASHARSAFSLRVCHGLNVAVTAVVDDEDISHRNSFRSAVAKSCDTIRCSGSNCQDSAGARRWRSRPPRPPVAAWRGAARQAYDREDHRRR